MPVAGVAVSYLLYWLSRCHSLRSGAVGRLLALGPRCVAGGAEPASEYKGCYSRAQRLLLFQL